MSEKEFVMTKVGLKKMEDELEHLKTVRRKEVAGRIKQAIEFGDISENSEYEDAKNEQAFIEGAIYSLEQKLRHVRIIDANEVDIDIVSVGCKVSVENTKTMENFTYTIVGSVEANPRKYKISNESPVGKALIGHAPGDLVDIVIPAGDLQLKILNIEKQD
ncbi:MAG: transcription elongation factor GreA [Clostridiales bacterium]|jgi:transcription elongation factor GreA|nr:transcription elongation factor GreA [Clostridiales bacterium]